MGVFVDKKRKIGSRVCCTTMIRKRDGSALLRSVYRPKFRQNLANSCAINKCHFDSKKLQVNIYCIHGY